MSGFTKRWGRVWCAWNMLNKCDLCIGRGQWTELILTIATIKFDYVHVHTSQPENT